MSAEVEMRAARGSVRALSRYRALATDRSIWRWYRREVVGRLRRLTRWEFWPAWAFYPPVVMYLLYLGLKHKNLTLFTAANPGIPDGGFIGESKYKILRQLELSGSVPRTMLLKPSGVDDLVDTAKHFMRREGLAFPIVLKPDVGQRGSRVSVIRSFGQMREYLAAAQGPVIAQEYVAGLEFGVFYYRLPGWEKGQIFSITEKVMPVVTGDGKRTLEDLMLADDRAMCMAELYIWQNSAHAKRVLDHGERVQLVELGTHCRGAVFFDGSYAITPALESAIENIARTFQGFYFGRFDIRVPSVEDLKAGCNLKVLELNGVTSEATNIYDPQNTLLDAYRVLFRQWRIAFEIGERNRVRGAQTTSLGRLVGAVLNYRQVSEACKQQPSRELVPDIPLN